MDVSTSIDKRSSLVFSPHNNNLTGQCQIGVHGRNCQIIVDEQHAIGSLTINVYGNNNTIHVADKNYFGHVQLRIRGHNSRIMIGSNNNLRSFVAGIGEGNSSITIGNDCLFSIGIEIRTHDSHKIIDLETDSRINPPKDVVISDRVWIGQDALLLKGTHVGTDSVIGVRSVVTGSVPPNSVAVGVPARVVRSGIRWAK